MAHHLLQRIMGRDDAQFRSQGQRRLMEAVVAAEPGARVVGVLPPDSGKSLAFFAAIFLVEAEARACRLRHHGDPGFVGAVQESRDCSGHNIVFVAPLLALQYDMLRRLAAMVPAWRLEVDVCSLRTADEGQVLTRLGTRRPTVFLASPKATARSLNNADAGRALRWVVLDEVQQALSTEPTNWSFIAELSTFLTSFVLARSARRVLLLGGMLSLAGERQLAASAVVRAPIDEQRAALCSRLALQVRVCADARACELELLQLATQRMDAASRGAIIVFSPRKPSRGGGGRLVVARGLVDTLSHHVGDRALVLAFNGDMDFSSKEKALRAMSQHATERLVFVVATEGFGLGLDVDSVREVVIFGELCGEARG